MAKIFLDKISKLFKPSTLAVDNLTLEIPDRQIVSLLGPSGCGKTTTMRMICGLEDPTDGRIFFDDVDVTDRSVEERDVAMVFQFPIVYPALSVFDNIAFPLRATKIDRTEIEKQVKDTAKLVGLSTFLDKKPAGLDAGKRQRVALARAIVRRPKAYLFDEPLSSLDPRDRVELRSEMKRLQKELGQTIVFVTHDQAEALTMGDRIAVMKDGRLQQYDTPENVYNNSSNTFVAYFMGNPGMNLIDCSYVEGEGYAYLHTEAFKYDVSEIEDIIKRNAQGNELVLGIRPEHVEVRVGNTSAETSALAQTDWYSCKSILAETLGKRLLLHLKAGDVSFEAKTSLQECAHERQVWFRFPKQHVKIFDKKSGRLIA